MNPSRLVRAFTLIELLVVVVIIALLLVLLLPALSEAKKHAQSAVCKSNLHGLNRCASMYEGDYGFTMPHDSGPISWAGPDQKGFIYPYIGMEIQLDVKKRNKIWMCPAMIRDQSAIIYQWNDYAINSYSAQSAALKVNDFKNPAGTMQFADVGYGASMTPMTLTFLSTQDIMYPTAPITLSSTPTTLSTYQGYFHGRHPGNRGNVAWYDGHVDEQTPVPVTDNPTWTPFMNKWHTGYLTPVPGPVTTSQLYNSKTRSGRNGYFFADPDTGRLVSSPNSMGNF